jgi:hypothetical protein
VKTYNIAETAEVLRIRSEKTIRAMVRNHELKPLPDTGGQGRKWLFNAQDVHDYAENKDIAFVLARAVIGFHTGQINIRAADYWRIMRNPDSGKRIRHGLEFFGIKPAGPNHIKHDYLPHIWHGKTTEHILNGQAVIIDTDRVISICYEMGELLARREVEFLIASLIAATFPSRVPSCAKTHRKYRGRGLWTLNDSLTKMHTVKKIKTKCRVPEQISFEVLRRNQKPSPKMAKFWSAAPALVKNRTQEEKAIISDFDLLMVLSLNAGITNEAVRAQVQRLCSDFGISYINLKKESEARLRDREQRFKMQSASKIGRIMGIQRAQANQLWRNIKSKLHSYLLNWYTDQFEP